MSLQSASTFVRRISARIASYTDQQQLSEIHSFLQRCHVPPTNPSITKPCMHALAIVILLGFSTDAFFGLMDILRENLDQASDCFSGDQVMQNLMCVQKS